MAGKKGKGNNKNKKIKVPSAPLNPFKFSNFSVPSSPMPPIGATKMSQTTDLLKQRENFLEQAKKIKGTLEGLKKKIDPIQKKLRKKYPFIQSISLFLPNSNKVAEEELIDPKDYKTLDAQETYHLLIIFPKDKLKEESKFKLDFIKEVSKIKPKIWVHTRMPEDFWEACFDSKYSFVEAVAMSFPIYDKGFLGSLRTAMIHKILVLGKFEKYVVSYVIAGSVVRGDTNETSDVDVFVVIDDTDVKRLSRFELKEKLRAIIYQYIALAEERAGVKNKLNVQVYILTEFWEAVKDAHPVIFTFIRDGVPLYDRGAFMPWKLLLKMGKIKPSPEAIEMFMAMGDKVVKNVKKKLLYIATEDVYWGVITPSQAVLMLYGLAPPTPKEIVKLMEKVLYKEEKLLEKKYINILAKVVKLYKGYEHKEIKEIKGVEIDKLLIEVTDYIKRIKKLVEQIQEKTKAKLVLESYNSVVSLLEKIFGKLSQTKLIEKFDKELVRKGKIAEKELKIFKELIKVKKTYKKKKIPAFELELIRKKSVDLTNALTELLQRQELVACERNKVRVSYFLKEGKGKGVKKKEKEADLYIFGKDAYLAEGLNEKYVVKVDIDSGKQEKVSVEEFRKASEKCSTIKQAPKISKALMKFLRKRYGDFEIIF